MREKTKRVPGNIAKVIKRGLVLLADGARSTEERVVNETGPKGDSQKTELIVKKHPPDIRAIEMLSGLVGETPGRVVTVVTAIPRPDTEDGQPS